MIRPILVLIALGLGMTAVAAQGDPVARRKELLNGFGAAARDPGAMLKGEQNFDITKVHAALRAFMDGSQHLPELFPAASFTGDTAALPIIGQEPEKFKAIYAKLRADSQTALTTIKDEATFKTEFPKVLGNCGACHNTYRARRS